MNSNEERDRKDFWLSIPKEKFNDFLKVLDQDEVDYQVLNSLHAPYITYIDYKTGRVLLKFSSVDGLYFVRRDAVYKQTT